MSLVVVLVDSLRQDALACTRLRPGGAGGDSPYWLPAAANTPTLDRVAAEAVVFEQVVTAAPWTVPAVAAMLTGVYAHRLGLAKWEQPWPADYARLGAGAARAGP